MCTMCLVASRELRQQRPSPVPQQKPSSVLGGHEHANLADLVQDELKRQTAMRQRVHEVGARLLNGPR